MGFFSKIADALTFHGNTTGPLKTLQTLSDAPGSLGSLVHAISRNKWNQPFGSEANSADIFAGGFSSRYPAARTIGRKIGSYYAGSALGSMFSGGSSAGSAGGEGTALINPSGSYSVPASESSVLGPSGIPASTTPELAGTGNMFGDAGAASGAALGDVGGVPTDGGILGDTGPPLTDIPAAPADIASFNDTGLMDFMASPNTAAEGGWYSGMTPGDTGAGETFGMTGGEGPAPAESADESQLMQNMRDQELKSLDGKVTPEAASKASWLKTLARYGPLALTGVNQLASAVQSRRSAAQIRAIGGPQREAGQQLIGQYQRGELSPKDAYNIEQWQKSAIAQSRQYFANAGGSDSSAAMESERQINAQAAAMKDQSLRQLLTIGTNLLNQTDQYQLAAVNAELNSDAQARNSMMSFMNAYGAWMRSSPTMTGE